MTEQNFRAISVNVQIITKAGWQMAQQVKEAAAETGDLHQSLWTHIAGENRRRQAVLKCTCVCAHAHTQNNKNVTKTSGQSNRTSAGSQSSGETPETSHSGEMGLLSV